MAEVFIIGLPTSIRARVEAEARRNGMRVSSVLAATGPEGTLRLVPHPRQAIYTLRAYLGRVPGGIQAARVIALPYAVIPEDVRAQLETIPSLGGSFVSPIAGQDGWVALNQPRPDAEFLNELTMRLLIALFPNAYELPSAYFRAISDANPRVMFHHDVFAECDLVAEHRRPFLRRAADAFADLAARDGKVGRLDEFFRTHGLDHAQTGGIRATLQVYEKAKCLHDSASNAHLKQGDKTTAESAARIYYHTVSLPRGYCVIVVYAGPHPNKNVVRRFDL